MRLIQPASYLMPWSPSLLALALHLWTSQEPIAASTSTPVYKVSNKQQICLRREVSFRIGGYIEVRYAGISMAHRDGECPLWVISGFQPTNNCMSALCSKADIPSVGNAVGVSLITHV